VAKQEPDSLGEDIFDKLNEIPVVEEASIHTMTFIADGTMVLPPAYTKDCVSLCHEFVLSCVSLLIRVPMDEARSDAVRKAKIDAPKSGFCVEKICVTVSTRQNMARQKHSGIADTLAAGARCGVRLRWGAAVPSTIRRVSA
jgi:hypothetical protein